MNRKKYSDNQKRALILEKRLARLENLIKNEAKSKKFESFESDLDEAGARAAADRLAKQFGRMIGATVRPDDLGGDVIESPRYGWLSVDRADEIADDPDARFVFQYSVGDDFSALVVPSNNSVELMTEGGYAVDPSGETFEADTAVDGAFPLSDWEGFDLSMVRDEDDWDDDDEYDESLKRRIARLEKTISSKRSTVESKRTPRRCKNR